MPAEMDVFTLGMLRDAVTNQLSTLNALERANLPGRRDSSVYRAGQRAQARVVQREMKKRVRVRTGRTKSRIKIGAKVEQGGRTVGLLTVPPPWNILEFGRTPGPGYGGAPAYPFITVSIVSTELQQIIAAGEAMQNELAKQVVSI